MVYSNSLMERISLYPLDEGWSSAKKRQTGYTRFLLKHDLNSKPSSFITSLITISSFIFKRYIWSFVINCPSKDIPGLTNEYEIQFKRLKFKLCFCKNFIVLPLCYVILNKFKYIVQVTLQYETK